MVRHSVQNSETEGEAGVGMAPTPLQHEICEEHLWKTLPEVHLSSGQAGIPWMCCGGSSAAINQYKCFHFSGAFVPVHGQVL